ncbi:MAG: hypothetical protein QOI77_330 [Blastocatellia bacterium]|jgi:hypothetical protein|nr:hypothetical protein [Blastocatellia bacterium]
MRPLMRLLTLRVARLVPISLEVIFLRASDRNASKVKCFDSNFVSVLCASAVNVFEGLFTAETQRTLRGRREQPNKKQKQVRRKKGWIWG